ncbi:MAG: DUF2974 domain-containing protein [Gammaproteobacteria bacterium]|nr:DUF2974 domain-containing protein [Gammaproteobacteria bacterium]
MPSIMDLAVASSAIYEHDVISVGPWTRIAYSGNDSSGFYAGVFSHQNGRDMVVAFRGTDDIADGVEDFGIFLGQYPGQAVQANDILKSWKSRYGRRRRVYLTGHSLGGGLASLMAYSHELPCVTFNAPGMARTTFPAWVPGNIASVLAVGKAVLSPQNHILHIRASYDLVSVGTGPRLGIVHNISLSCSAPTRSTTEALVGAVVPGYATVRNLVRAGDFVLCQHSMDNVVGALRGNPRYAQELNFANFQ